VSTDLRIAGLHHWNLSSAGQNRHALVYVPAEMPDGGWPVILMLHGSGATSQWMLLETRWDELADRDKFLVVLPDASLPQPDMPLRFFTNPQVWNDASGLPPASWVQVDDVMFLRTLLDELPNQTPVDESRIFVTGFSNGASMAFRLGLELSDRIAAIAPVAGYCWARKPASKRVVPALYMVGTEDPLVPVLGGTVDTPWGRLVRKPPVRETLQRWANLSGLPPEPGLLQMPDDVAVEQYGDGLTAWFIPGLGHHWPGGRGGLNARIAGPFSDRVLATNVIWQFFQNCRLA
jgi:polyhydroxybutyrate depolymerase